MKTPEERYRSDPVFHALVEALLGELRKGQFTPSELREAVLLAATMHELTIARAMDLDPPSGEVKP